jgi:hypothetical protein
MKELMKDFAGMGETEYLDLSEPHLH